jgi:thioredoxin reductase
MAISPAERSVPVDVDVDVVVVGAGPAGVAAAVTAAESGARVTLVDAGARPGGQYYRRPTEPLARAGSGVDAHRRWREFDAVEARLRVLVEAGRVRVTHDTVVWAVAGGGPFVVHTRGSDRDPVLASVTTRCLVIATGAFDRHLPFPGWDLPGVMSGGAAQALVKGSRVLPGRRVVVAGTGPFLLAVAATVLEAGGSVAAVVEANAPESLVARAPRVSAAWARSGDLARFSALLARHRVPYLRRHRVVEAIGSDALTGVTVSKVDSEWRQRPGTARHIACDTLAVGFGFTAQTDLPLALGCAVELAPDGGLAVTVDDDQRSTVPGVLCAGETTGVGGADLALTEGVLAGAAAATFLGLAVAVSERDHSRARTRVRRLRGFAAALHESFAVHDGWRDDMRDDTVVCRCEEVRLREVREARDELGAPDARTVKLFTRAGMGWCQGRICGYAVDRLCSADLAASGGAAQSAGVLAAAARRPVATPISLGALAARAADLERDRDPAGQPPAQDEVTP